MLLAFGQTFDEVIKRSARAKAVFVLWSTPILASRWVRPKQPFPTSIILSGHDRHAIGRYFELTHAQTCAIGLRHAAKSGSIVLDLRRLVDPDARHSRRSFGRGRNPNPIRQIDRSLRRHQSRIGTAARRHRCGAINRPSCMLVMEPGG